MENFILPHMAVYVLSMYSAYVNSYVMNACSEWRAKMVERKKWLFSFYKILAISLPYQAELKV